MTENKETGEVSHNGEHPLKNMAVELGMDVEIEERDIFNLPSPHMTPQHMLKLSQVIHSSADDVDGFVITHGTDTLEETAYFLDLTLGLQQPVIVTGAMRSSNELGSDAVYNLASSIQAAADESSRGLGVLVVMNGEIHAAREVEKRSSIKIEAFKSANGPLGSVLKDRVVYHRVIRKEKAIQIGALTKSKVMLLKAYSGMDRSLLEAVQALHPDGLVIEAMGQGNLPEQVMPAIEELIEAEIPIVLVSRCAQSIVQPTYGYIGGGRQLKEMGLIFASGLNGQKARLKLMALLNAQDGAEPQQLHF